MPVVAVSRSTAATTAFLPLCARSCGIVGESRIDRPLYPVILHRSFRLGLVGFLLPSRPDSNQSEANVAKTSFLQACGVRIPALIRGACRQMRWALAVATAQTRYGAKPAGRRALLEENN